MTNFNLKKIALIITFLIIVIALGFALYFVFFKSTPQPEPTPDQTTEIKQLSTGEKGQAIIVSTKELEKERALEFSKKVTKIPVPIETTIDTKAQGGITKTDTLTYRIVTQPQVAQNGKDLIFYDKSDGSFININNQGITSELTSEKFPAVQSIAWSQNTDKAILEFPDGSNILYDFNKKEKTSLPKTWTDFKFNTNGDKLASKDLNDNPDYNWLVISNPDGSNQKYIESLGENANQVDVNWSPTNQVVALYYKNDSADTTKIYMLGQNNENFKSITANGFSIQSQWSPTGEKLLYSSTSAYSEFKPVLNLVDSSGEKIGYNNESLQLNTWANKCTFSNNSTAYCAVPKHLPSGAGLQPNIADDIPDYLYKIDLKTGLKSLIAEPDFNYTMENLVISNNGQTLYFTDKQTKALHKINL